MEKEMAPFYSKTNGIPSATNGQCVLINETQNVVFTDQDQVKCTDQISVKNPMTKVKQDTMDTSRVRTASARRKSIASLSEINLKPSKLVLIIGVCCVTGLALPPIILHFIPIDSRSHDDVYISDNFSMIATTCNTSLPNSTLFSTYEALRAASQFTSQYCITKLSEALTQPETCKQFNNFSYITDIMCQQVRQNYCTAEWRTLELNSIVSKGLIDCSEDTRSIDCGEQFGLAHNDSICLPLCNEFSQYGEVFTRVYFAVSIISHITNLIGGIAVLIIAFCKRQKMFRFPQVLIVMNVIIMIIIALFLLIPLINLDSICSTKYLDLNNPTTAFCQLQGFVWTSGIVVYGFFWFLFIFHLALRILSPLKSSKLDNSDHSRRIHTIEIVTAMVIGIIPYIVFAGTSKYQFARFPPFYCLYNSTYIFYGTILPTLIPGCVGLILMLFVLYKIHIHHGIFRRRSAGKRIRICHFTTPEVKIFLGFCYLLIVLVLQWTVATLRHITLDSFTYNFGAYIRCMSTGIHNPNCEGFRRQFQEYSYPGLDIVYVMLVGLLNFSNLQFVVQFRTVKYTVRRATKRLSTKSISIL